MNLKITLLALCFCFQLSLAQDNMALLRDAESYSNAMIEGDIEKMVQFTVDQYVDMGGGPFYIAQEYADDQANRAGANMNFLGATIIIDDAPVVYKGELQVLITQEITTDFNDRRYHTYNNLLAISTNKGESWKFIDLAKHDANSIKDFVPHLSPEIEFPVAREAVAIEE